MGAAWSNFWVKHDPDDMFSYKTVKFVRIKDRRLGILHYSFQFLIFIYIVLIVLFMNRGYMYRESPVGSLRYTLRQPKFTDAKTADYCTQNPLSTSNPLPCVYWDENDVLAAKDAMGFCITTRVKETEQQRKCDVTEFGCKYTQTGKNLTYYAYAAEKFTMFIDHNVRARTDRVPVNATLGEMVGSIKSNLYPDKNLGWCGPGSPCRTNDIGEPVNGDIISVQTFIDATKYTLDELSASNPPPSTNRNDGLIFVVEIQYSNERSGFDFTNVTYNYEVSAIPGAEFKYEDVVYNEFPGLRTVLDRHGIRIIFLMSGMLGWPDIQVTLVQLVSAMALLTVATTIVDIIALNVMPQKKHYTEYKYQVTEDFSDIRDGIEGIQEADRGVYGNDDKVKMIAKYQSMGSYS